MIRKTRKRKIMKLAKGFRGAKHKRFVQALESVRRAQVYAYRDRKVKKRAFRRVWQVQINAFVKSRGISYSRFIEALKKLNIALNRKMLSELANNDEKALNHIVEMAKA